MRSFTRRSPSTWAVVFLFLALSLAACATEPDELRGTVLSSGDPASAFTLTDQFGETTSLTDFQGDVVALTFLYTYCPDVCPVVANHLRTIQERLGQNADQVSFVIVSVDPERDTVERAHEYSQRWKMLDDWRYLVGTREELEPVWEAYFISAFLDRQASAGDAIPTPVPQVPSAGVDDLQREIALRYTVAHSSPIYLIDQEGRRRVLFTLPLDPGDVVRDINALLE